MESQLIKTIRKHRDAHKAAIETDAYSAQEYPKLAEALLDAKELIEVLNQLMNYVGGWDEKLTHPCGKAAKLLRKHGKSIG